MGMDGYLISEHFSLVSQRYAGFWIETSSPRGPWGIGRQWRGESPHLPIAARSCDALWQQLSHTEHI